MFDKICIKSNLYDGESVDVASLIDIMLFYGEVNVLVHENEIAVLLKTLGESLLTELVKIGRIKLFLRQNLYGIAVDKRHDTFGCGLFSLKNDSLDASLYRAHRLFVKDSSMNMAFASRFCDYIMPFKLKVEEIDKFITRDFDNHKYLHDALIEYLKIYYPTYYRPTDIEVCLEKSGNNILGDTYSVQSNLDINKLNEINIKNGYKSPFSYGGFLLTLAESRCDNYTSALFESELRTNKNYTNFISLQLSDSVKRADIEEDQINMFYKNIMYDCTRLGQAFIEHKIDGFQLLKLLEEGDERSTWLRKQPNDSQLITDYIKECNKKILTDNICIKGLKYVLLTVLGFIDLPTSIIAAGLSFLDTFYLEKLLRGWTPNLYIDDTLKDVLQSSDSIMSKNKDFMDKNEFDSLCKSFKS